MSTAIVWFRRDLRLDDHPSLAEAAGAADRLLPVYAFDPREFGEREYGGPRSFAYEKTGGHRARFLRESVADLRERLRDRGSDLIVRHESPETALEGLIETTDADTLFHQALPTAEEQRVERAVEAVCADHDVEVRSHWGHTLHHPGDLPRSPETIPDTFTPFRKEIEVDEVVREPIDPPDGLPGLPSDGIDPGEIPSLSALGLDEPPEDERAVLAFEGGEAAGRERLEAYLWEEDRLREYKRTRNGLLGAGYSSKLSPWLNLGCLSPRRVYAEVERYERERVENDSTYWLVFELRWRDFFAFQFLRHGSQQFRREGIRNRTDIEWREDREAFERWCAGETGIPFVDANVRELNLTGFMSNRGRQNVASFLAKNLRLDWRWGAAYFETRLVDYDPCSNYGNWAYVAGVGNDSRDNYFDIVGQARRYDPDAEYVRTWLPELSSLPADAAHEPWAARELCSAYGVELGVDYPEPMLDLEASYERLR